MATDAVDKMSQPESIPAGPSMQVTCQIGVPKCHNSCAYQGDACNYQRMQVARRNNIMPKVSIAPACHGVCSLCCALHATVAVALTNSGTCRS